MLTQRVTKFIADSLPMHCEVCRLALSKPYPTSGICEYCALSFAPTFRCLRCGLTSLCDVPECGQCLKQPPKWQRLYCVSGYHAPLASYVHKLKYERQFWQAGKLSALLAPRIETPAELITYVPLHWWRYLQRSFNQSELLALSLARELDLPCESLFKRVRATAQQQGLTKVERQSNLRHAFVLSKKPAAQHIAIVDDVLTTGSTVAHLCQLLLDIGVKRVDIYCICRTPEPANE